MRLMPRQRQGPDLGVYAAQTESPGNKGVAALGLQMGGDGEVVAGAAGQALAE